jgi:hypothetical protein
MQIIFGFEVFIVSYDLVHASNFSHSFFVCKVCAAQLRPYEV